MTMCEQCRYADLSVIRGILERARPDQILRLLRDIRRVGEAKGGTV